MTAPMIVEGLAREDLDAKVQELVSEYEFDLAVECIAEWVEWDWHGRWDDSPSDPAEGVGDEALDRAPAKKRKTVNQRIAEDFGGTFGPGA